MVTKGNLSSGHRPSVGQAEWQGTDRNRNLTKSVCGARALARALGVPCVPRLFHVASAPEFVNDFETPARIN